ncbi:MAG: carbohydrate-binding protein [Bacillota bacterium]
MQVDDRVQVDPNPVRAGGPAKIMYNGLLAKSGADRVFLHYGVDGWKKPTTIEMTRVGDRFESEVKTSATMRSLDFCFKDSADHWDNNNGLDWHVSIV